MNFDSIIGQKEIINGLENSIKNHRIGHAYIFSGPKGIGKKTVAKLFAGILLCEKNENRGSCGECMSCRMLEGGSNPDLRIIEQDNSSISIEEIRKIQGDIIIRPMYSSRKVYLISDAENMTPQAQNCLLKILEEPPKFAVIILSASNYGALLETIRSRAVRFNFKKNSLEEIKWFLEKKFVKNIKGIDFIASYADGVIGTAIELADNGEFVAIREKTIEILLKITKSNLVDIFEMYDFFEDNKASIDTVLDIMLLFYRDLLVLKKSGKENILINSDKKDIILNNITVFSTEKLSRNIEMVEQTRKSIKQNANYQLSIEVMLMKLQEDYS